MWPRLSRRFCEITLLFYVSTEVRQVTRHTSVTTENCLNSQTKKSLGANRGSIRWRTKAFKTESTRKLSNFNIQWTKTLYQSNLKHIAFLFFTFFKG